ncbi:hypothetical protein [Pelomonas sp. SE-A7]|uniref:hypothetical protein n=1 Tax=Pelomonas sp. SE-A7 TaxID=3054953 RepID=UPI00259C91A5|nr:hypothetical protein [Pelomonas sp. SE-A7]MDM4766162.1 hypothetical protein [Pelomonas sp. SE-A7]
MQWLRDASSVAAFLAHNTSTDLNNLINERMAELADYDDYDIAELVNFIVVDPSDSLASISRELGFELGDVSRPWESFTAHGPWHEVVFVLGDDGFGLVIYIPADDLIDPMLADLCLRHAAHMDLDP